MKQDGNIPALFCVQIKNLTTEALRKIQAFRKFFSP